MQGDGKKIVLLIRKKKMVFTSYKDLALYLMQIVFQDENCPWEARRDNLVEVLDMCGFSSKKKWVESIKSPDELSRAYWNMVLSFEELGLLPGFSVIAPIEKGRTNYNPERYRMSENWLIYEEK